MINSESTFIKLFENVYLHVGCWGFLITQVRKSTKTEDHQATYTDTLTVAEKTVTPRNSTALFW